MRDLGLLPGGTFSSAAAINDLGVVAGTADGPGTVVSPSSSGEPSQQCSDLTQPFVWTQKNGMKGLGTVPFASGGFWSLFWCDAPFWATGINGLGNVIGYEPDMGTTYEWGFLWTKASGMSLFADGYQSAANGINNRGQVVGNSNVAGFLFDQSHAVLWQSQGLTDLGTLSGPDTDWFHCSSGNGVNDLGHVVGWSDTSIGWQFFGCALVSTGEDVPHAFLWTPGSGMRDLGTLPGDTSSVALKINLMGQIIGSSGSTVVPLINQVGAGELIQVVGRPFIWTKRRGMSDLNTLIPQNSTLVLNSVADINVWGQIVGSGTRNGQPHGFLLTPVNPFKVF